MKKGYIMIFVALWVIMIFLVIGFIIFNVTFNLKKDEEIEISEKYEKNEIIDNSIEIITTATKEEEKETTYILKEYNENIAIYVLDENGKEHLRETTQILTKYLPEIDREKLKIGIRVVGKENLNKAIEDYE